MKENTAYRWMQASIRAYDEGVNVHRVEGDSYVATSTHAPGESYLVTNWWCSCKAARMGDPVCKHRAALHKVTGFNPNTDDHHTYLAAVQTTDEQRWEN